MRPAPFGFLLLATVVAGGCAGAEDPNAAVDAGVVDGGHEGGLDSSTSDARGASDGADAADATDATDGRIDDAIFFDSPADVAESSAADVDVAESDVASADLVFPSAADPGDYVDSVSHQVSRKGNYVSGTRTTTRGSVTGFSTTLQIVDGLASDASGAGTLRLDVSLNGTKIGSAVIDPSSGDAVPMAFDFPAVAGPTYLLEYRVTADVAAGYGWVDLKMDVSHVALR